MLWPCPRVKVKPRPGRLFPENADGPAGAVHRPGRRL